MREFKVLALTIVATTILISSCSKGGRSSRLVERIEFIDSCTQSIIKFNSSDFKLGRTDAEIYFELNDLSMKNRIESMDCPFLEIYFHGGSTTAAPYRDGGAILPETPYHLIVDRYGHIEFFESRNNNLKQVFLIKPSLEKRKSDWVLAQ